MGQIEKELTEQSDINKNQHSNSNKRGSSDEEKLPLKEQNDSNIQIAKFFNLFVISRYIISDMKKKPRSYKIGVFTVTLTVTFCIVLY